MRICYLGTSAALKLLIEEKESRPLSQWLNSAVAGGMVLCASFLLHTELHCAARRRRELDERTAAVLLSGVELIDVSREHLLSAFSGSMGLRAADDLQNWFAQTGWRVKSSLHTTPRHAKAQNAHDPLAFARERETTTLYCLERA